MGIFDTIKYRFKQKDILVQLIIINAVVFFVFVVTAMTGKLFKLPPIDLIPYIGATSDVHLLIKRPWTVFTYMFAHKDFLHLLLNMLMLFWFGQLFLRYFSPKNLGSIYLLGGLAGAALYALTFNTIPYYVDMNHPPMIGASASVMAIIFAAAFYKPDAEVSLFMLFRIKVVYIAVFMFIIDFISLDSNTNPGGHVSHIGGAITGYIFAGQYLKGKDITRRINKIIDSIVNLIKPSGKKKMKVKYKKREADYDFNQRKHNDTEEIDRILDKIKSSGYSSLNAEEKKRLFDASKK
ncbi:MAG: rhomboid family intramembrane serine protease [Prevotella sp.]|jgi:membrane associated rhomboid family serine protease|nr:rhomboid family intramembrane serine protease [Prevotella sp.]